jgi:hypothetical protein
MRMDHQDIRKQLKTMVSEGTLKSVSDQLSVSVSYLHDVVRGRRKPGKKILKGLGIERRVEYVEKAR